jgi:hypothetical protein
MMILRFYVLPFTYFICFSNVETQTVAPTTMWPLSPQEQSTPVHRPRSSMSSPGNKHDSFLDIILFDIIMIILYCFYFDSHVGATSTPYMTLRSSRRRLNQSDSQAQQDTPSTLSLRFV